MSSPLPIPPGFEELSRREQLEFIEKLLDHTKPNENYVDIPEWHREFLEELLANYHENGFEGTPWEEFEQELEQEFFQANNLR